MIDKLYHTARLRPNWLVFTLGLCLLSLATSAQQFPFLSKKKQERRIAFIIGNSTYQNLPELHTPINDAKAIKARLQQLGFAVKMLADADSSNVSLSLKSIQDTLQENDVVFFYFSGYGINKNKTNYILPIDAQLNPLKNTISLKGVKDNLSSKKVKYCFMVLDANRELFDVERLGIHSGFVQDSTSKNGNVLSVFAAKEGNLSNEQQDFQNSTFSASLIRYLGKVNTGIRTVLDSTINDVSSKTTGLQTPVKYDELSRDIQLINASRPARVGLKILVGSTAIATGLVAFVLNNNYQNKKILADNYAATSYDKKTLYFKTYNDYITWQKAYDDAIQTRKTTLILVNTLIATSALSVLYEGYLLFIRSPEAINKKLQNKGLSFSPAQRSLGIALRYTF